MCYHLQGLWNYSITIITSFHIQKKRKLQVGKWSPCFSTFPLKIQNKWVALGKSEGTGLTACAEVRWGWVPYPRTPRACPILFPCTCVRVCACAWGFFPIHYLPQYIWLSRRCSYLPSGLWYPDLSQNDPLRGQSLLRDIAHYTSSHLTRLR